MRKFNVLNLPVKQFSDLCEELLSKNDPEGHAGLKEDCECDRCMFCWCGDLEPTTDPLWKEMEDLGVVKPEECEYCRTGVPPL